MKPVILVLVCVVLVGCTPKPKQGLPINGAGPCMPANTACIVSVGGVSLIRAPTFWLLDLRGLDLDGHGELDVAAITDVAKQCDGPKGCGIAMTRPEIEKLVGELAQVKLEQLAIPGGLVAAYRFQPQKAVLQIRGDHSRLAQALLQLPPIPDWICPECGLCLPAQCEVPPPIPPRTEDLYRFPGR